MRLKAEPRSCAYRGYAHSFAAWFGVVYLACAIYVSVVWVNVVVVKLYCSCKRIAREQGEEAEMRWKEGSERGKGFEVIFCLAIKQA